MDNYFGTSTRIDHIAIAVENIDEALILHQHILGFSLLKKREIVGSFSGMKSAELDAGGFSVVLLEGVSPESQVSRYIEAYGPGVQHVAIKVDDVEVLSEALERLGVRFATSIIRGEGLVQIFTQREENSGMMLEFIERQKNTKEFEAGNIQQLFEQLKENKAF